MADRRQPHHWRFQLFFILTMPRQVSEHKAMKFTIGDQTDRDHCDALQDEFRRWSQRLPALRKRPSRPQPLWAAKSLWNRLSERRTRPSFGSPLDDVQISSQGGVNNLRPLRQSGSKCRKGTSVRPQASGLKNSRFGERLTVIPLPNPRLAFA